MIDGIPEGDLAFDVTSDLDRERRRARLRLAYEQNQGLMTGCDISVKSLAALITAGVITVPEARHLLDLP